MTRRVIQPSPSAGAAAGAAAEEEPLMEPEEEAPPAPLPDILPETEPEAAPPSPGTPLIEPDMEPDMLPEPELPQQPANSAATSTSARVRTKVFLGKIQTPFRLPADAGRRAGRSL